MYGYLRNCLWQTSLGITACGAAVPCGLIHNTLLALPEIKRATVGCKGKIRERKSESVHYLYAFKFPAKGTHASVLLQNPLPNDLYFGGGGGDKKRGVARGKHDEEINLHSEGKRGQKKNFDFISKHWFQFSSALLQTMSAGNYPTQPQNGALLWLTASNRSGFG